MSVQNEQKLINGNENVRNNIQQQNDIPKDESMQQLHPGDPNNFQVKPSISDTFKIVAVKSIIRSVLTQVLEGKTYNSSEVATWTKRIADDISSRVKDLEMKRYQHVVQVMLAQQTGAGSRYIARCCWDAECDCHISDFYANEHIVCVVSVFGIYLY